MITKILLTIFVIVTALVFVRHKNSQNRKQALQREAEEAANRRTAMFVAAALVGLTLLVSGGLYYDHWKEQHRIFIVQVINSHSGEQQRYEVYRKDIDGRSFSTIEGRLIQLSDAERMEVELSR